MAKTKGSPGRGKLKLGTVRFKEPLETFLKKKRVKTMFVDNMKDSAIMAVARYNSTFKKAGMAKKSDGFQPMTVEDKIKHVLHWINDSEGVSAIYRAFFFPDAKKNPKNTTWDKIAKEYGNFLKTKTD